MEEEDSTDHMEQKAEEEGSLETGLIVPPPTLPSVTPEQVKEFQQRMTILKESILTFGVDYKVVKIGGKPRTIFFRTGWEKIAMFFGISTKLLTKEYREYERIAKKITRDPKTEKIIKEEIIKDTNGNPIMQKHFAYEITVQAYCGNIRNDAVGACSSDESKTFNHPIHDILATAHTRAKNRAILALVGAGLSFEEIADVKDIKRQGTQKAMESPKGPLRSR